MLLECPRREEVAASPNPVPLGAWPFGAVGRPKLRLDCRPIPRPSSFQYATPQEDRGRQCDGAHEHDSTGRAKRWNLESRLGRAGQGDVVVVARRFTSPSKAIDLKSDRNRLCVGARAKLHSHLPRDPLIVWDGIGSGREDWEPVQSVPVQPRSSTAHSMSAGAGEG